MRRRRSRLEACLVYPRTTQKDNEGVLTECYNDPFEVEAETWPAGGNVEAKIYGERLTYICNCRIAGKYTTKSEDGHLIYALENGTLKEKDKFVTERGEEYQIIAIKPYKELRLEMEKL